MDRRTAIIDVSVRVQRALFKLRTALGGDAKTVLRLKKVTKPLDRDLKEFQKGLRFLRRMWPKLTPLECIELASTITQAASLALLKALDGRPDHRVEVDGRPYFHKSTTSWQVTSATRLGVD